jgi:CxxH/CxxC protein (TIGR04129 family)
LALAKPLFFVFLIIKRYNREKVFRGEFMYVVCNDHLETAIEDFVETYEQSPDIYELDKVSFKDWASPNNCEYCNKAPRFLVL